MSFCGIHLRTISQRVLKPLFLVLRLKVILLKLLPHHPGANGLKPCIFLVWQVYSCLWAIQVQGSLQCNAASHWLSPYPEWSLQGTVSWVHVLEVTPHHLWLDSFTVPLHSPNGRHLPAIRAVQRDCHWGLKNWELPLVTWAHNATGHWSIPIYI